jgi:hypothetical protein
MTVYSKRFKKYTKNIKAITKRCRYKRKNSIRNKILHGGDVRTLEFICDGKKYTLTKDRGSFPSGISGVGKYKLEPIIKEELNLKEFMSKLILPANSNITHKLYSIIRKI